jgi:hypothetical protein
MDRIRGVLTAIWPQNRILICDLDLRIKIAEGG